MGMKKTGKGLEAERTRRDEAMRAALLGAVGGQCQTARSLQEVERLATIMQCRINQGVQRVV